MIFPARTRKIFARSRIRRRGTGCGSRYGGSSITKFVPSPLNTNLRITHAAANAMSVPST